MPPKGKRSFHKYTENALNDALNAIRRGDISILGASKKYGVPRATLQDKLSGRAPEGPRKMGPPTILTTAEEEHLKKWCLDLAKCGFPIKIDELLNTVQKNLNEDKRVTPFKDSRPGRKWFNAFLRRHPDLSIRESEGITKGRAIVTEETIRKWFSDLKTFLEEQNATDILEDPSRIFNGDETSFSMCPKTGKVLAPKGYRNVYSIQKGNEKETVTVLLVFSANGKTVNPMVVFPFKRVPKDVVNSLPETWFLGKSETGWMISDVFFEYIANCVHKWLEENQVPRPVLLFVDGHKSHMTMELSEFCENNKIILYALPPNTTHIMQPADVSVFKPLKSEWKNTLREWQNKTENINKVLSKCTFCPLLHSVLSAIDLEDTIKNGFRKCGLYPFNPENVDYTKCVRNNLERMTNRSDANNGLHLMDFDKAIQVINLISSRLNSRGIDANIVVEEIESLKNSEGEQDIELLANVTVQPSSCIVNKDWILEKETRLRSSSPLNENNAPILTFCSSPTTSRNVELSLKPTKDSPKSSVTSALIRNVLSPVNLSKPGNLYKRAYIL